MGARGPPHRGPAVIRSWVEEGVGRVHLDDAEHRNDLALEHSREIAAAMEAFDDVGAIVLTAADPVFCSGGVLDDLINPKAPLIEVYAAFDALRFAPVPTIAVVTGPAIGAGVNRPRLRHRHRRHQRGVRPPVPRRRGPPRGRAPVPARGTRRSPGRGGALALR